MERLIFSCTVLAALAAGIAFAQTPNGNSQPDMPSTERRQDVTGGQLEKLAQIFDLTDSQKENARMIFGQAELSAQPARQESQKNLDELWAAAKAGKNEREIQKLAEEQRRLLGQLIASDTNSSYIGYSRAGSRSQRTDKTAIRSGEARTESLLNTHKTAPS